MKKLLLLFALLFCGSLSAALGQCRLLDRTTYINPTPVFAEEFTYSPGYYNKSVAGNWANDAGFDSRWGGYYRTDPALGWDKEDYNGENNSNQYYSPSALEITAGTRDAPGTLKIHVTALAAPTSTGKEYKSGNLIANPAGGFMYGLFEIRCKLPQNPVQKNGLWPSFWLISSTTEIDIFDQVSGTGPASVLSVGVLNWQKAQGCIIGYNADGGAQFAPNCFGTGGTIVKYGRDLSADFNLYSMLWTPRGATFFLNERALLFVPSSVMAAHAGLARMYLQFRTNNLALSPKINSSEMEVDYIRVYSLKSTDTISGPKQADYLTTKEYMHHNIISNDVNTVNRQEYVNHTWGSIAVNPNNANQLFFIGTDNLIYRAEHSVTNEGQWSAQALDWNNQGRNWAWKAVSDLFYNATLNALIYRGNDNWIHQYKQLWADGPWQHRYVFPSRGTLATIYPGPNCLSVAANGDIFYIAADKTIKWYQRDTTGGWSGYDMPYTYVSNLTEAKGNLMTQYAHGSTTVFYQGMDNRIHNFWWNTNSYAHSYVSPSSSPDINSLPGSISQTDNGDIIYIDDSSCINNVYYARGWQHRRVSKASTALGLGGLTWDQFNQQIVYTDFNGGVQGYKINAAGAWASIKVNEYYPNTDRFQLFAQGTSPSGYSSIVAGPSGNIFYRAHDDELQYFVYEPCTISIATLSDNKVPLNRVHNVKNVNTTSPDQGSTIDVRPNPVTEALSIKTRPKHAGALKYKIQKLFRKS